MTKKYCMKCGNSYSIDQNFCGSCGVALTEKAKATAAATIKSQSDASDEDGPIDLSLAKKTKQIDFEIIPNEAQETFGDILNPK